MSTPGKIHPDKWKRLYKNQGGRCYYCLQLFQTIRNSVNALRKATVDHIVPRCELKHLTRIEQNTQNNVLCCVECNRRKANISAELFLEGYEALNISEWDQPSFYIAVKTRSVRRWWHRWKKW